MANPDVLCVMGTSVQKIPSDERSECLAMGGTIQDPNSIDPNTGTGLCFVRDVLTKALSEEILRLGGTYQLAVDFRNEILNKAPRGKRMLRLYYRHVPDFFLAVTNDPRLLLMAIDVWRSVWLYAHAVLEVSRGRGNRTDGKLQPARYRLSIARHRKVSRLAATLQRQTSSKDFRAAIAEFSKEWSRYEGLDAEAAVRMFRRSK
jgi:hypothetical protein